MERSDVEELHFMTHSDNLPSLMQRGILCHTAMADIPHKSIASEEVQGRRAGKRVPGGRELHEYVNLYFDARNPMMYLVRRVWDIRETVVLRVSHEVLDLPGVVVTDGNAASSTTDFHDPINELDLLDKERIFAPSWNKQDPFEKAEWKRQRCAEVLVPEPVHPSMFRGLIVETEAQASACQAICPSLTVEVKPHVFFR